MASVFSFCKGEGTLMFDSVITNGVIVTVDDAFTVLPGGAVAIRAGCIERVWQPAAGEVLPPALEVVDARGGIVMPGLVNAHTHLPMSLFRGLADDLPLRQWLEERIFPVEARFVTPDNVRPGTLLSCAEMLLGGVTTCCDGYFLADEISAAVIQSGMRAVVGQGVIDFPAPGVPDPGQNLAVATAFVQRWKAQDALLRPAIFCHSPYTCSTATLQTARAAADELDVLLQIHVAETRAETEQCRTVHGCSPVAYLDRLGVLNEQTLLVHAVWIDGEDIRRIADRGARIAHCPESNMKLGSGIAPVPDLLKAGIAVGLGTDGCAGNNDLNLFGEMGMAARLHKVQRLDPMVMGAAEVIRMATRQGALAVGWADHVGSLEPGKCADLIVLAADQPHLTPLYHPASHIVYAADAADVRHVMVDGRWVVRDRQLPTIDLENLLARVNHLARRIG